MPAGGAGTHHPVLVVAWRRWAREGASDLKMGTVLVVDQLEAVALRERADLQDVDRVEAEPFA